MKAKLPEIERISINASLAKVNHPELPVFYAYALEAGPEMALTEYAARLCYNSVKSLGSAPGFVRKVLQHGHLSVAEHASFAVFFGANSLRQRSEALMINKFFYADSNYLCGNMRSWIEYVAKAEYAPYMEVFLSAFPAAFGSDPLPGILEADTVKTAKLFISPFIKDVYLLSVNFGNTGVESHLPKEKKHEWGRLTFLLEGISRACSHQIARHRSVSISEQSLRYVDAGNAEFVYPPGATDAQRETLRIAYEDAIEVYRNLRGSGMKKEDARFALPLATKTRMVFSIDFNDFANFCRIRCAKDAQWEVRQATEKMLLQAAIATNFKPFFELIDQFGLEGKYEWEREITTGSE